MSIEKILDLFAARERQYEATTDLIIDQFPNLVAGAVKALDLGLDDTQTLTWKEITITETGVLSIVGIVGYNVGESVMDDTGNIVMITDDNYDQFVHVVRVGLPIEMAIDGTVEEIVEFLEENSHTYPDDDDFESILNSVQSEIKGFSSYSLEEEFDISGLSEEQIENMIDNEHMSQGKIH